MSAQRGTGLTLVGPVGNKGEYRFRSSRVAIGSDPSNELVIDEPTVSRRHAEVIQLSGVFQIRDLGSTNGTFVNGKRVEAPTPIEAGDEVRLGGVRIYVRRDTAARPAGRRFPHTFVVFALFLALGALSYQFVGNWLQLLEGADGIASHQTRAVTPHPRASNPPPKATEAKSTPVFTPSVVATIAPALPSAQPSWLAMVNHYRELAHLDPVLEDSELSRADRSHAQYLVVNFSAAIRSASLAADAHREDDALPGSSVEGDAAAHSSDIDAWQELPGGDLLIEPSSEEEAPQWNINRWMSVPFHRSAILNPFLKQIGFGMYCASGVCAAGLDVYRGVERPAVNIFPFPQPVVFPPDKSEIPLRSFYLEWPDPRSSCPGYKSPNGTPITLELGISVAAKLEAFSVYRNGEIETALEACGFDEDSYLNPDPVQQARGRSALHGFGMVVVIPRRPLDKGATYHVTLTVNGTKYGWSFSTPKPAQLPRREVMR